MKTFIVVAIKSKLTLRTSNILLTTNTKFLEKHCASWVAVKAFSNSLYFLWVSYLLIQFTRSSLRPLRTRATYFVLSIVGNINLTKWSQISQKTFLCTSADESKTYDVISLFFGCPPYNALRRLFFRVLFTLIKGYADYHWKKSNKQNFMWNTKQVLKVSNY